MGLVIGSWGLMRRDDVVVMRDLVGCRHGVVSVDAFSAALTELADRYALAAPSPLPSCSAEKVGVR